MNKNAITETIVLPNMDETMKNVLNPLLTDRC